MENAAKWWVKWSDVVWGTLVVLVGIALFINAATARAGEWRMGLSADVVHARGDAYTATVEYDAGRWYGSGMYFLQSPDDDTDILTACTRGTAASCKQPATPPTCTSSKVTDQDNNIHVAPRPEQMARRLCPPFRPVHARKRRRLEHGHRRAKSMTLTDGLKILGAIVPLSGLGIGVWSHIETDAARNLELKVLRCQNDASLAGQSLRDAKCWQIVLKGG